MSAAIPLPRQVPVFPLPTVVLFPNALLPLRIFESRYRTMLKDVLDSHGCIAMALLKPGWESQYFQSPDVFPIVGVGRVLDYKAAERGTFNVILLGVHRAEIDGWVEGGPYRRATVHGVAEEEPPQSEREKLRARLRRIIDRLTRNEKGLDAKSRARIRKAVEEADQLGFLVDSIAYHFLSDPREKQRLLEAPNALERERLLREFLVRHDLVDEPVGDVEYEAPGEKASEDETSEEEGA